MKNRHTGGAGGRGGNASVRGHRSTARGGIGGEGVIGPGGPGGDADVQGHYSVAVGGPGGRGGVDEGSPGGGAAVRGDNMTYAGGEGGEARQPDGRGGRGGRSGYHTLHSPDPGRPDEFGIMEPGRGGDSAHSPRYAARLMVLEEILGRAVSMYAASAGILDSETSSAILNRINEGLRHNRHAWQARVTVGCFEFYDV